MAKRSPGQFARLPQDQYATPLAGVEPLLPYLDPATHFVELCTGEGLLAGHLKGAGHVLVGAYDLLHDARTQRYPEANDGVIFCTDPPWRRDFLPPAIVNLSDQAPTWLLIDADYLHTRQSIPFMPRLRAVISVGHLKRIPGSPHTGKDNAIRTLWSRPDDRATVRFIGRQRTRFIARSRAPNADNHHARSKGSNQDDSYILT